MTDQDIDLNDQISDVAKTTQEVNKALGNPLTELLGPSAKLLGQRWALKLSQYLDPDEKENLNAHVKAAIGDNSELDGGDITPRQIGAMLEWTDSAKSIEPNNSPKLSEA